ncbi:MAG: Phosphoribosylglycinamide formyltransferase [Planctomycetes bacterium]|nr:Phosphoribosylglycinamide formyltransferase [Planctomycetota bacterium]
MSRLRVAVLASGSGTTFENLVLRCRDGSLAADVVWLGASRPGIGAIARAERLGVPCDVLSPAASLDAAGHGREIGAFLDARGAGLCAMAGFLRLWTIPERWRGRVMNVHPALLPAFGGKGMHGHRVHEAVVASGAKVSGCTVHFADDTYDTGPIIVQRAVPVTDADSPDDVAARVMAAEREAYPEAVALFAAGRLRIDGRIVRVLPVR